MHMRMMGARGPPWTPAHQGGAIPQFSVGFDGEAVRFGGLGRQAPSSRATPKMPRRDFFFWVFFRIYEKQAAIGTNYTRKWCVNVTKNDFACEFA